jgi:hypothetical protein
MCSIKDLLAEEIANDNLATNGQVTPDGSLTLLKPHFWYA